ncbi:HTH-type transcriptional regulator SarV, partial [Staphylococcus aureus]|nr:HTH-type transcriptional regulator SarV [Staphylococcus aureus]
DERQVFYFYSTSQKKLLDKITKEIEVLSVTN